MSSNVVGHLDLDRVVRTPGSQDRDLIDLVDFPVAEKHRVTGQVFAEPPEVPVDVPRGSKLLREISDEEVDTLTFDEGVDHAAPVFVGVVLGRDFDSERSRTSQVIVGGDHPASSRIEVDDMDATAWRRAEAHRQPKQRVLTTWPCRPPNEKEDMVAPARCHGSRGLLDESLVFAETERIAHG
jgi:hypothetical protein